MMQILMAIWFFLVINATLLGWNFALTMWDPFKFHKIVVATPTVHRGEELIQLVDIERFRICKVTTDRFMIHREPGSPQDNKIMMRQGNEPAGASLIGRSTAVPVHIKIPNDVLLGKACLIQQSFSQCIDGMHSTVWPEVCFDVVE